MTGSADSTGPTHHPPSPRPIRFGFQLSGAFAAEPIRAARRAEELGFDMVLTSDHVGPGLSPMTTLAAVAAATERVRLGTFVLNNDMRNPVQLAWEAVSLDRLSGGRFELGVGAGHTPHEYAETGVTMDAPRIRKERLVEALRVLRPLLAGATVDFAGEHVEVSGAHVGEPVQTQVPILVGGNGARLLGAAGELADIIGLQGLGRTLEDGHRHEVKWTAAHLDDQVDQVRAGAGDRFDDLELNALAQVFSITDDREAALREITDPRPGLSLEDAGAIPYLLIGSVDEIVGHIEACRDRWGISYFVVRALDDFAPILDAFR